MKKQRSSLLSLFLVVLLIPLVSGHVFSDDSQEMIYGHISYVENDATVIRQDKTEHQAVVNLPVAPGDQVITGEKGRCEVQFDNGTILRLDKDSRLKVETILAPSLTSRWKITTLQLMRGQLSSMAQAYNREMFQIITPNAAVELKKRSTAFIRLKENGDTFIFAQRGKFQVMYGEGVQSLKTETLRSGNGYTITADHRMLPGEGKRDFDFVAWNEYVNRNFRDLHYGISKVPKKIYRYSKGLVYWAEKWSSLFGEWVYDDLFGYVWKPADELFSYSRRPFFHANFVRVNGKLFLVPQQAWGWVPAHMGTWVWMTKNGWVWIPGSAFSPSMSQLGGYSRGNLYFMTLGYWLNTCYGDYELYSLYRDYGVGAWRNAYREKFNVVRKNPVSKEIPKTVRQVINRLNKAPVKLVKERLGEQFRSPVLEMEKVKPLLKSLRPSDIKKGEAPTVKTKPIRVVTSTSIVGNVSTDAQVGKEPGEMKLKGTGGMGGGGGKALPNGNFRDWNPDSRWAAGHGYTIHYSPKKNAVLCPTLKLSSQTLTRAQRSFLRRSSLDFRSSSRVGGSASSGSASSGSSSNSRSAASSISSSRGSGGGGHAGTGGSAKEKQ
jgi:hypothetical protein